MGVDYPPFIFIPIQIMNKQFENFTSIESNFPKVSISKNLFR